MFRSARKKAIDGCDGAWNEKQQVSYWHSGSDELTVKKDKNTLILRRIEKKGILSAEKSIL